MCNTPVPSVTLQTAVLMQVKAFANKGQTFSVFDITKALRDQTAQGLLEIPEVEVGGRGYRFDIGHAKVKALFIELRDTGVFDPDFGINASFNGTYMEYAPYSVNGTATAAAPAPSAPVASAAPTKIGTIGVAPVSAPATPLAKVKTAESEVTDRVKLYLANCTTRTYQPTLKQVQSAIKRGDVSTGWTCDELQTLVETMGYKVVANPDFQSASQVVV